MDQSSLLSQVEAWKFMPVHTLIRLCQTDKQFYRICSDNRTWKYLLNRDFGVDYLGREAKALYFRYQEILNYFTPKFPIITEYAVEAILNFLPRQYWDAWMHVYNLTKKEEELILDFTTFNATLDELDYYRDHPSEYGDEDSLTFDLKEYVNRAQEADQYISSKLVTYIPDVEQLATKVDEKGCDLLIPYSKIPTKLFVSGKLKIVPLHPELITYVEMHMKNLFCGPLINHLTDEIKALIE